MERVCSRVRPHASQFMSWHHTLILLAQLLPIPSALPAEVVLFLLLCWWQLVILELFTTWKILLSWVIAFTEELLNNQYEGLNFPTEDTDWQHCWKIALATVVLLGQRRKVPSDTRIKSLETLFVLDKETEPGRGVFPTYGQFAYFVNSITPTANQPPCFCGLWKDHRAPCKNRNTFLKPGTLTTVTKLNHALKLEKAITN